MAYQQKAKRVKAPDYRRPGAGQAGPYEKQARQHLAVKPARGSQFAAAGAIGEQPPCVATTIQPVHFARWIEQALAVQLVDLTSERPSHAKQRRHFVTAS